MNSNLTRRSLMKGLTLGASGTLLGPVLAQLSAQAEGTVAAGKPKRFVFVIEGNGLNPMQIQPTTIPRAKHPYGQTNNETLEDLSLTGHELPEAIAPLKPLQDRLTIVQGLSGRICGGGHSNNFGALGCYSAKAGVAGETIDIALGRAVPGIFSQIGLGISDRPEHTVIYNTSACGPDQPAPTRDRKSTRLNSSHIPLSRMPSSA